MVPRFAVTCPAAFQATGPPDTSGRISAARWRPLVRAAARAPRNSTTSLLVENALHLSQLALYGPKLTCHERVAEPGPIEAQLQRRSGLLILRRLLFEPGGLPGPRRRRRRRPFFGAFFGKRLPKRLAIALRTSVCTSSRMTVMMLFCRGIPHLLVTDACPIQDRTGANAAPSGTRPSLEFTASSSLGR